MDNCIFKNGRNLIHYWTLREKVTPQPIMFDILSMALEASDPYLTEQQQAQLKLMIEDVIK